MPEVQGVECTRYHRGIDGEGTCDTRCQWSREGYACPFWVDEVEWEANKDKWNAGITIEKFAKDHGIEITIDHSANQPKPSPIQVLIMCEQEEEER